MAQEKPYLIPKNLQRDFIVFGNYTIADIIVLLVLFGGSAFNAYLTQSYVGFGALGLFVFLKFEVLDHAMLHWMRVSAKFLYNRMAGKGVYYLFEKEED